MSLPLKARTAERVALVGAALLAFGCVLIAIEFYQINRAHIETKYFPVVIHMEALDWEKDDQGRWSAKVFGVKKRTGCVYDPSQTPSALVRNVRTDVSIEVGVSYPDDTTPGSTRPPGKQYFDRWRLETTEAEDGDEVLFTLKHFCTPGRTTITHVGPFTIGVPRRQKLS